jgi:hypothetical protein
MSNNINKNIMKRSMIFKSLSIIMVAGAVWSCSSKQVAQKSGNEVYDDLYAQVGETSPVNVSYKNEKNNPSLNQNPEWQGDERTYNENDNITNEYYSESGIDSRDYTRNNTDRPGYSDYTDGYRDGIADSRYNWGSAWNSGFGGFNRFNSFNSFGSFYNPGLTIIIGGRNRFGNFYNPYNSFGFYDPFYSPYAFGGFGGFNSFGYGGFNNFGYGGFYDSFYNPYGFNNYYGGGFGGGGWYSNPRNYSGNYANNGNILGADRANRNYGPRNGSRNSAAYNDQFVNTAKPRNTTDPNMRKGTTYTDAGVNAGSYGSGAGYSARPRGGYSNGTATNSTSKTDTRVNSANGNTSTGTTRGENSYSRLRGGYLPSNNAGVGQPSTGNSSNARPSASDNNTYYARPSRIYSNGSGTGTTGGSTNTGSSPSYQRGTSSPAPRQSSDWNSGNSSSGSSRSSGSYSPSSSGSSSSGSSSRGSSSGSSSGGSSSGGRSSGGGSRGPR